MCACVIGNIIKNVRLYGTLVVLYTTIQMGEMAMDMCHIELVAGGANDSSMYGSVWLCLEPENEHDSGAVAAHDVDGRIGYVSRRFSGLAREDIFQGARNSAYCSVCQNVCGTAL
jgi:hypothetical protein